jgi:hypothetical protein
MRERERDMLEEASSLMERALDIVATVMETRENVDENDGLAYDLRALYAGLSALLDDVEEIGYDL